MGKPNIIQSKSFQFAKMAIEVYKKLQAEKREFVLSKQLLRSATSIGANVEEAIGGQSRKDFIAKLYISYKEARETSYWLRLLFETDYINQEDFDKLYNEVEEIKKILAKIILSSKSNTPNK